MNKRAFLKITIFVLFFPVFLQSCYGMSNQLQEIGFVEINNKAITKNDYHKLYQRFDRFIDLMDTDKNFASMIYKAEKDFLTKEEEKKRYCGAPPSYRDPKVHSSKRFNKIYFQYIQEYYEYLKTNNLPSPAKKFLDGMQKVDATSKIHFNSILDQLEHNNPGIKKLMYANHQDLTVISKIVRYKKDPAFKWGTTPHFDKSALTLIWDSNDENHDSLIVCDDPHHPSIDKLHKPQRMYAHQEDATSALLITGSAFKKSGWDIKPTLHGVTEFKKDYRHAIISFLLIPDIDMSDLQTDYEIN